MTEYLLMGALIMHVAGGGLLALMITMAEGIKRDAAIGALGITGVNSAFLFSMITGGV